MPLILVALRFIKCLLPPPQSHSSRNARLFPLCRSGSDVVLYRVCNHFASPLIRPGHRLVEKYVVILYIFACNSQTLRTQDFPGQDSLPTLSDILHLNATNGTFLPLKNIQADILFAYSCVHPPLDSDPFPLSVGMKKPTELFYFFRINEAALFKAALRNNVISLVTSAAQIISPPAQQPLAFLNIAFSHTGLAALGILDTLGDPMFTRGQWADAPNLNDDTSKWEDVWKDGSIHGVFLIGSDDQSNIDNLLSTITGFFGFSITEQTRIQGAARPGNQAGHERKMARLVPQIS